MFPHVDRSLGGPHPQHSGPVLVARPVPVLHAVYRNSQGPFSQPPGRGRQWPAFGPVGSTLQPGEHSRLRAGGSGQRALRGPAWRNAAMAASLSPMLSCALRNHPGSVPFSSAIVSKASSLSIVYVAVSLSACFFLSILETLLSSFMSSELGHSSKSSVSC